jgi:hypothetical protein
VTVVTPLLTRLIVAVSDHLRGAVCALGGNTQSASNSAGLSCAVAPPARRCCSSHGVWAEAWPSGSVGRGDHEPRTPPDRLRWCGCLGVGMC